MNVKPADGYMTLSMAILMEVSLQESLLMNWTLHGYVPAVAWAKRLSLKSNELSGQVAADIKKKRITISDYPLKVGGYLLSHLV